MSVPCPLFLQNDEENLVLQQVKYAKKKRRGINMRKYQENGMLESVVCNGCGKKLVVERGILRVELEEWLSPFRIFRKKMEKSIIGICARTAMTV